MMEWQPIETLQEDTLALLWCPYGDEPYEVDKFRWRVVREDELVSATETRKVYETRERHEREWTRDGWSATHWMPLPSPPPPTDAEPEEPR